jgi:hypothetical protein
MLRLVAIRGLYCLSMMFLCKNKVALLLQMEKNPSKVDSKFVKIHKQKLKVLLAPVGLPLTIWVPNNISNSWSIG